MGLYNTVCNDTQKFSGNQEAQDHAARWAWDRFGGDYANTFVCWLLRLEEAEQEFIYRNGYKTCERNFEEWLAREEAR